MSKNKNDDASTMTDGREGEDIRLKITLAPKVF